MDAEGYFWLTGRVKELIIRGGHNINPLVIEDALHKHPAVQLAAAVGRPDPYSGEVPMAHVSLKPGSTAAPEELLEHCKSTIGKQAVRSTFGSVSQAGLKAGFRSRLLVLLFRGHF